MSKISSAGNPGKPKLRSFFRAQRNSLSEPEQQDAAIEAASILRRTSNFRRARNIGFYWPNDGELSPLPSILATIVAGKGAWLPIIPRLNSGKCMRYGPVGIPMKKNRFGIPEPALFYKHAARAVALDLIIVPLVAFDENNHRLGMGGGFYDSTLKGPLTPPTIGFAHQCQFSKDALPHDHWDKPLDKIIAV